MRAKIQTRAIEAKCPMSLDSATIIFGLAMAAVFVGMMILNAMS
jgi:hypothetical protein